MAVALVNLWVTSGGASWVGCRFQKVAFHMSEALHWPKMLPLEGFLEVRENGKGQAGRGS